MDVLIICHPHVLLITLKRAARDETSSDRLLSLEHALDDARRLKTMFEKQYHTVRLNIWCGSD